MMKKLLSIVAVGVLLSSGVQADTFEASATIPAVASVGLGATSAIASNTLSSLNGVSTLVAGTTLTLTNVTLSNSATEFPVNMSTNTKGAVTMTVSALDLLHTDGTTSLITKFSYTPDGGGSETPQTATGNNAVYTLSDGALKDNALVGQLKVSVEPTTTQLAGVYTKAITTVISAAI
jgi:hypothetical protein